MTLILNIHGRDYPVPPALEPEPAHCAAFDAAIRAQLQAGAAKAGIPKTTIHRAQFTPDGGYQYDTDGKVVTVAEQHWLDLPAALHDAVVVPTAEAILPPVPVVPAPTPAPTPVEED